MRIFNAARQSRARSLLGCKRVTTFILGLVFGIVAAGCDLPGVGSEDSPPDAPTGLSAVSENSAIILDWTTVQVKDLSGYNVYRSTSTIADVSTMTPVNEEDLVSEANYTDSTAENGNAYHYVVTAVDGAGNESNPSGEVKKTPFAAPPDRP